MKVLSTNTLANHPAYGKIIEAYNARLNADGKVNAKKFYEEVILPEFPTYHMKSWYFFLKRLKTADGILPTAIVKSNGVSVASADEAVTKLRTTLLSNSEATQKAIATALNLSADALQDIMENPQLLSTEKKAELFLKVMKAQDSRVKAIGTIRADNRDQERFDRAMDSSAYG